MSSPVPVQNDWVRGRNRLSIYRLLLGSGAWTRAEVARDTGLSVPTVSTILSEFGKMGLVRTAGEAQPRGGRPAQFVYLDAAARHVLALDLSANRARAALLDLRGNLQLLPEGPELGPGRETLLMDWIRETLAGVDNNVHVARLAAAVPGVVDDLNGHVRLAPALGWSDFPLADVLSQVTDLPIVLENDVNALALAEETVSSRRHDHALFVRVGGGIGASLLIGGGVYRGANRAAGEIGYSRLPHLDGSLTLGAPGPLEAHLISLEDAFLDPSGQLALTTRPAREAFETFADTLGLIMHNLVCLLNPECVIISWPADPSGQLAKHLGDHWRGPLAVRFEASRLDDSAALRGVARLALEALAEDLCLIPSTEGEKR